MKPQLISDFETVASAIVAKSPLQCECGRVLKFVWGPKRKSNWYIRGTCQHCGHKYPSVKLVVEAANPSYHALRVGNELTHFVESGLPLETYLFRLHLRLARGTFGVGPRCLGDIEQYFRQAIPTESTKDLNIHMAIMKNGHYTRTDSAELYRTLVTEELASREMEGN